MAELTDRMVGELVDAVRQVLRRESQERLRDVYLVGDIEKDTARSCIERLRELANDGNRPITLYINSAGGNVTDGLAIHDSVRHIVSRGIEVTIIVQGMAYSMGSIVLQAASEGRRLAFPHSWIMIHEPAKWAGWQSTSAAAQHLERLKQMQDQIYKLLSSRSGKPLRQIIRDTKRTDFYLDAQRALEYGLIDAVLAGALPEPKPVAMGPETRREWRRQRRCSRRRRRQRGRHRSLTGRVSLVRRWAWYLTLLCAPCPPAPYLPDVADPAQLPSSTTRSDPSAAPAATLPAGGRRSPPLNAASASNRGCAPADCGRSGRGRARPRTVPAWSALP
jgi:ATP-dependent Clp protease protease subunit